MKSKFYQPVILIVFCLSFAFMGCGGGSGSGDGGGDGNSGLSYTGATAPAEVDENNAVDLAAGAFAAGQAGTVMTVSEVSQDSLSANSLRVENFRTLRVPQILGDAARSMDLGLHLHQLSLNAEAVYTEKGTEYGPCGGSFSYTVNINDVSGEFDGTFIFSNYCDHGVTISGKTEVEGRANIDSGDIIIITFRFDNLSDGTMTMDGEMSMDFSDVPITCTLNALLEDKATGKVYWAKNYSLNIYEYPGRIEVEIFGTFYHPYHGHVVVTTEEVFVIYEGDDWPSSGILLMVGANNTRAKLTAIDETTCRVEADTDGDGVYDWDSGPLLWSDYQSFDQIEITSSYVQYRTYSDAAGNRYQGWVSFLNDGRPIEASDIADIVLKDQNQNEVDISLSDLYYDEYYYGGWNSGDGQIYYSGPYSDTGFSIYFPEATALTEGNYTYEATTMSGRIVSQTLYFPGKLELEAVDAATMASEWINGDLKLTWTNPDPGGLFEQVRVRLQSGDHLYLTIRLPNTASEVTIPEQWINNVKQLSNADTMDWIVLFYAIEGTTNNQYARSQSDTKPVEGWDNIIPPGPPGQIQNPGFEEGAAGWVMSRTTGTDCTLTIDSDAYDGAQAAKLTVTNEGYCMLRNSTSIPINQTGTYRFNSYAKVSGDVDHLTIAIWKSEDPNEPPNTLVDYINPNAFSGDYELNQLIVDLSAGDYIRLELGIDNNASGTSSVLFDNLEIVND
jgi:hypothetical protein